MNKLLLAFYGDDFTGSTDALEQLTLAGIQAALFIEPPKLAQLKRFPALQAVGVAGISRSLAPQLMKRELRPTLKKLKALGARHIHYKVCSTFDSSPKIGNLGCVLDVASEMFHGSFVPLLVAAPSLGRHCVFGNLFARFGIGSNGQIHRLDRHPAISEHPVTPMKEADLRLHLAKQTNREIALFDILQLALPEKERRAAFEKILAKKPGVVLFDALYPEQLPAIGALIDSHAGVKDPLFSIGSSAIETALAARHIRCRRRERRHTAGSAVSQSLLTSAPANQILVGSGSCSLVTEAQIRRAVKRGFAEVVLNAKALIDGKHAAKEMLRATSAAVRRLRAGRSVIVHTTRRGADKHVAGRLKQGAARVLGTALGEVLRSTLEQAKVSRICIAGGDTASFAARAMGIEALEMIAPLTPGAPLCRAFAQGSPADGLEIVFKGGQVGPENYFEIVKQGGYQ